MKHIQHIYLKIWEFTVQKFLKHCFKTSWGTKSLVPKNDKTEKLSKSREKPSTDWPLNTIPVNGRWEERGEFKQDNLASSTFDFQQFSSPSSKQKLHLKNRNWQRFYHVTYIPWNLDSYSETFLLVLQGNLNHLYQSVI